MAGFRLRLSNYAVFTYLLFTACGCSTAYYSSQAWQRSACREIQEQDDQKRCLNQTEMSYQRYQELGPIRN